MLAYKARVASASRLIPIVKSPSYEIHTDPLEACNVFANFYSLLYTSESSPQDWDGHKPLDALILPQVSADNSNDLGAPLTAVEIAEAIKSPQSGKSPGPDGYATEFYRTVADLLTVILVSVYNDTFDKGQLLPSSLFFFFVSPCDLCLLNLDALFEH